MPKRSLVPETRNGFLSMHFALILCASMWGCARSGPLDSGRIDCGDGVGAEVAHASYCAYLPDEAPAECTVLQPKRVTYGGVVFCTDNLSPSREELGAAFTIVVAPEGSDAPLVGDVGAGDEQILQDEVGFMGGVADDLDSPPRADIEAAPPAELLDSDTSEAD